MLSKTFYINCSWFELDAFVNGLVTYNIANTIILKIYFNDWSQWFYLSKRCLLNKRGNATLEYIRHWAIKVVTLQYSWFDQNLWGKCAFRDCCTVVKLKWYCLLYIEDPFPRPKCFWIWNPPQAKSNCINLNFFTSWSNYSGMMESSYHGSFSNSGNRYFFSTAWRNHTLTLTCLSISVHIGTVLEQYVDSKWQLLRAGSFCLLQNLFEAENISCRILNILSEKPLLKFFILDFQGQKQGKNAILHAQYIPCITLDFHLSVTSVRVHKRLWAVVIPTKVVLTDGDVSISAKWT